MLIDGTEFGQGGVLALAQRALALKVGARPNRLTGGGRLAAVFMNPSLRTRTSLEAACGMLGIQPIVLEPGTSAWKLEFEDGVTMDQDKAEHIKDAARVLSEYADLLAVRAFAGLEDPDLDRADPVISAFREYGTRPLINLESALWHPLQGLADTATWVNHLGPDLQGKRLTLAWAPHPKALPAAVPNQVLLSAALQGMEVTIAHPPGFDLDPQIVSRASQLAEGAGGAVQVRHDTGGYDGAQVVVAKSWSGFSNYGQRQQEAAQRATLSDWTVTESLMAQTANAGFMHCLPVRRNVVVEDAVLDGPNSWVIEEAGQRLWTAAAALEALTGGAPWM